MIQSYYLLKTYNYGDNTGNDSNSSILITVSIIWSFLSIVSKAVTEDKIAVYKGKE